ncbi:MAG: HAMP domain-containing histidine kinase, partial [candidate division Zixibacteria bacterium]|nr:HAMP domain-containing histidine kinase [candidate division Zixibacteria bacterium]
KDVGKGTGLGLSVSHDVIEGHGGRIEVRSEVGQGAEFIVSLPIKPSMAATDEAPVTSEDCIA